MNIILCPFRHYKGEKDTLSPQHAHFSLQFWSGGVGQRLILLPQGLVHYLIWKLEESWDYLPKATRPVAGSCAFSVGPLLISASWVAQPGLWAKSQRQTSPLVYTADKVSLCTS